MKRVICAFLIFLFLLSLGGCTPQSTAAAEYSAFLVSALGITQQNNVVKVLLESLAVNSEDSEAETAISLYKGEGENLLEALNNAKAAAPQPLNLGHCAALVLDNGITAELFKEICDYCHERELSLSVAFCFTENAQKLLSVKSQSTIALGYEIANMLTEQYSRSGIAPKNRYYELEAIRSGQSKIFTLPFFVAEEEECLLNGAMLFSQDSPALYLNPEQTAAFALATGRLKKGIIFIDGKEFDIKSVKSNLTFKDNGGLQADLKLKIKQTGKADLSVIKQKILELYELSKAKQLDIFSFADTLSKVKKKLWENYSRDFDKIYQNSEMAVAVE